MMRSPVISTGLLAAALGVALVGCKRSEPAPNAEAPAVAAVGEDGQESETTEMTRSELFGIAVPSDATLDERGETFAHYVIPGGFEAVVERYREQLAGYRVVEYDQGVKFEARDDSGRSVYVLEGDADDGVMVTYFEEEGGAVASSAVVNAPTGSTRVGGVPGTPEATAGLNGAGTQRDGTSSAGTAGGATSGAGGSSVGAIGATGGGGGASAGPTPIRRHQPRSNRAERGTTNPLGRRPINFTGEFEPPRNPNAYY